MIRLSSAAAAALIAASLMCTAPGAHSASSVIQLERVADGFTLPLQVVEAPDDSGRLFVLEKNGKIKIIMPDGSVEPSPFMDVGSTGADWIHTNRDSGLLGLLFHNDFATSGSIHEGRFFLFYTRKNDGASTISEFRTASGDTMHGDLATSHTVLAVEHHGPIHNGGTMAFGPDGMFYTAYGDGGGESDDGPGHTPVIGNAQDMSKVLGKMIRIDVNNKDPGLEYAIPQDNPFIGQAGVRPEIYAVGFRHPWRFSFDRGGEHRIFAGDVGEERVEEIDIVKAGFNYGWRIKEGNECHWVENHFLPNPNPCNETGLEPPIHAYNHPPAQRGSVTGGFVYRGSRYPMLEGLYFFADYVLGTISALREAAPGVWEVAQVFDGQTQIEPDFHIASFGQGRDGELFAIDITNGIVYRITARLSGSEPDWQRYQ